MTAILLLIALQNSAENGRAFPGLAARRDRPAVVRQADGTVLRRLARPFRRNR